MTVDEEGIVACTGALFGGDFLRLKSGMLGGFDLEPDDRKL